MQPQDAGIAPVNEPRPSATAGETPFADLTPEAVLDALDAVGLRGDGRLIQLNSYENRVFQVYLESGQVVVAKFYRPERWTDEQIHEEHAFAAELALAEIPVVGPLTLEIDPRPRWPVILTGEQTTLAHCAGQRYSVSPRQSGRAPELELDSNLEWIGRFIGRIHAVGATRSFTHRGQLTADVFGRQARDFLLAGNWIPDEVRPRWLGTLNAALDEIDRAFSEALPLCTLRLHGDCHPGNILWSDGGPHFVDLDDAVTGPAIQDLWMLLSGDRFSMSRQLAAILVGYEDFMTFDYNELRLIEPLRTLRLIHHSAWIAKRWRDPAFPAAFPWFNGPAYWQQQATHLNEQINAMREAPLGAFPK